MDIPLSRDGTLMGSYGPIPKPFRNLFIAELIDAGRESLAKCFRRHWAKEKLRGSVGQ